MLMVACKGLFAHARSIDRTTADEVISRVAGIPKSHATVPALRSKISNWYADWRYNLKRALKDLARDYQNQ